MLKILPDFFFWENFVPMSVSTYEEWWNVCQQSKFSTVSTKFSILQEKENEIQREWNIM